MNRPPSLQVGAEPYPGYKLVQAIGKGGYGEVWEAEVAGGPHVALKFMPFSDSMAASRELRAIQNIRQIDHPNLVHIEKVWSQPGYLVIVMELAEGSLADLYAAHQTEFGTPLEAPNACLLLSQAGNALDYLNKRRHPRGGMVVGYQHCDVKPSNMLLFGDVVKLCDFGLSSQTSSREQQHRKAGTLDYAAPEVFEGRLSAQSDQYSLAICYCELRGGRFPYPKVESFRGSWPRRRPDADLTMLAAAERPIIAKALHRQPQHRWRSCAELMAELAKVVSLEGGAGGNSTGGQGDTRSPPDTGR